ncbi:MAG TPA: cupin domain-containing protein [Gaiellaceae bacterium]|nr:cupin domain-containing protein [Gaiellaceae bacterium]
MTESALASPPQANGRLELGERLRAIRLLRRLTLRDVALAAGVSESFVSQLERGRSSASVATLQRLAAALGIEITDLFDGRHPSQPRVLRREARQLLEWGHLGRKALLTPKPFHSLEVVTAEFEPGGSTGDEPYTHGDSEELLLVLAGRVQLQLGTELFDLSTGDSVNYRSSTPHRVSNPGDDAAEVLFVISPPSY